ncbi:MAG: ribosome biogenesis GTPase YlqF [Polyangiaceae bacterium]
MIQWYPGHMTSARRIIAEIMPSIDVVIEVLDARMPRASANPVMTELRGTKPCVKILSKSDLADPVVTKAWIAEIQIDPTAKALATTTTKEGDIRKRIPELCQKLAPHRTGVKTLRTMIVGVPNVGKSTLINTLMQRAVAKTGDEPAVTKTIQRVTLKSGMTISDHPGLLWPKIEDENVALRLALGGAIPDTALDYERVALFGAEIFLEHYPEEVKARYKLAELPASASELLRIIGTKRGALKKGGALDMHKASDALIHDFRDGILGKISLERP